MGRLNRRRQGGNTRSISPSQASPGGKIGGPTNWLRNSVVSDRDIGRARQRSGGRRNTCLWRRTDFRAGDTQIVAPLFRHNRNPGGVADRIDA